VTSILRITSDLHEDLNSIFQGFDYEQKGLIHIEELIEYLLVKFNSKSGRLGGIQDGVL
jgi:Ca2+-binding EF-hand superfamily protein